MIPHLQIHDRSQDGEDRLTLLLNDWQTGDPDALERFTPLIYRQLRRLAGGQLRKWRRDGAPEPTALVHETFLRLASQNRARFSNRARFENRAHFFVITSHLMRRVLMDHARKRLAYKRQASEEAMALDEAPDLPAPRDAVRERLRDALRDLARREPRQSRIIQLRFFDGLTIRETAEALKISPATVKVDWGLAKEWLSEQLQAA